MKGRPGDPRTTQPKLPYPDLLEALDFASAGVQYDSGAYIHRETGAIYFVSVDGGLDEHLPADLKTSDRYLAVPTRKELDLGRDLALHFAEEAIPDAFAAVAGVFRSRGAA